MKDFLKRVAILIFAIFLFPVIGLICVFDLIIMILYYLYKGRFWWYDYNPLFIVFLELIYEGKCEWRNNNDTKRETKNI